MSDGKEEPLGLEAQPQQQQVVPALGGMVAAGVGSRNPRYTATPEPNEKITDRNRHNQPQYFQFHHISAMPAYQAKSQEELHWEDLQELHWEDLQLADQGQPQQQQEKDKTGAGSPPRPAAVFRFGAPAAALKSPSPAPSPPPTFSSPAPSNLSPTSSPSSPASAAGVFHFGGSSASSSGGSGGSRRRPRLVAKRGKEKDRRAAKAGGARPPGAGEAPSLGGTDAAEKGEIDRAYAAHLAAAKKAAAMEKAAEEAAEKWWRAHEEDYMMVSNPEANPEVLRRELIAYAALLAARKNPVAMDWYLEEAAEEWWREHEGEPMMVSNPEVLRRKCRESNGAVLLDEKSLTNASMAQLGNGLLKLFLGSPGVERDNGDGDGDDDSSLTLKELNLGRNIFDGDGLGLLAEVLSRLPRCRETLGVLYLDGNEEVTTLAPLAAVGVLEGLKELGAAECSLSGDEGVLPKELCANLPALEVLDLSSNKGGATVTLTAEALCALPAECGAP